MKTKKSDKNSESYFKILTQITMESLENKTLKMPRTGLKEVVSNTNGTRF